MWMKRLRVMARKMRSSLIWLVLLYVAIILGCVFIFLTQPSVPIDFIYNRF